MAGNSRTLLWVALLGGIGGSLVYLGLVLNQTSSTAAIGVIATPIIFVFSGVLTGMYAWGISRICRRPPWQPGSRGVSNWAAWLIALALVGTVTVRVSAVGARIYVFHRLSGPRASADELRAAWDRYADRRDYFILSAVARNPVTPPEVLLAAARASDGGLHEKRQGSIQLFDRDSLAVVRKVLRNPSMPAEALPLLAQSTNAYVLGDVAGHKQAGAPLLRELTAKSNSYLVLWGLARNPQTPPDILERISPVTLEDSWVLASNLARNPSTPAHVLEHLAGFENRQVRSALARNPGLPRDVMVRFATDPDDSVRALLMTNKGIDLDVIAILAKDPSERTQRHIARAYLNVGQSPDTARSDLARLAAHPDRNVRRYAGLSPRLDRALMEQLAADPDSRVRYYLAGNPAVDEDVMRRLAEDVNTSVRTMALGTLRQIRAADQPSPGEEKR